jgi:hypothetical protein
MVLKLRKERRMRVSKNRMLKRIFGHTGGKVLGEWRKLDNEELTDTYSSPNIIWVIKSRKMRWAGHVAWMGRGEAYTRFWWGNLRERDHWEDPGIEGRIIFRWIFRYWDGGINWNDLAQDRERWWTPVNTVKNLQVP